MGSGSSSSGRHVGGGSSSWQDLEKWTAVAAVVAGMLVGAAVAGRTLLEKWGWRVSFWDSL